MMVLETGPGTTADDPHRSVLIVGAGIAGMGTALLLAEAGYAVYLADDAPWIGGSLHLLDRTFPTDSCGLCLMSPVQPSYCPTLECGLHERITVLPQTEVSAVERDGRDWRVRLRHNPRHVIDERCTRCGLCIDVCPETRADVYEAELAPQRAIYRPPTRGVPNAPVIDMDRCTRCGKCVDVCPTGAIDLDMDERTSEIQVGAIVLHTGYRPFDARLKGEYGYGSYVNVVDSLQFERMTSASGSTRGHLVRPSDGTAPARIAFIHCVGSRDQTCGREYCSSVCCMYTAKQVAAAKSIRPDLEITVFHMDLRAGGKGYEEYLNRVQALPGVTYRRSMVSSLFEMQRNKALRLNCLDECGVLNEQEFDMVVLSVGLGPSGELRTLGEELGLDFDVHGFCRSTREGVFAGGMLREPLDIPETVVDTARVAAEVAMYLGPVAPPALPVHGREADKGTLRDGQKEAGDSHPSVDGGNVASIVSPPAPATAWTELWDEPARVGVFLQTGGQASWLGATSATSPSSTEGQGGEYPLIETQPGVSLVQHVAGGHTELEHAIRSAIARKAINRAVIVGGDRLVYHSLLGATLGNMGLLPGMVEWVDLAAGCEWVHAETPTQSRHKARQMLAMAIARVRDERWIRGAAARSGGTSERAVLVIGGGPAGMSAALALARSGWPVNLVERSGCLGGQGRELRMLLSGEDPQRLLASLQAQVEISANIIVHLNTQVRRSTGHAGRFVTELECAGKIVHISHGATIVATGGVPADPPEYGEDPAIWTQRELEQWPAEKWCGVDCVVMIQCAGSRDADRPYCSRICCSHAVKNALEIKRRSPETAVHILYRDVRTPGLQELAYQEARQAGVAFHRYEPPNSPSVRREGERLTVEFIEAMLGETIRIVADRVVLSTGIDGHNRDLAQALGVPLDANGFFREAHAKLRPLDFARPGIYACGLAHAPCSLPESIAQGEAAAMRAAVFLSAGALRPTETGVAINERLCSGCGLCVAECPYGARFLDTERGIAQVIEALCLGCGACAVVCRNNATQQRGYEKARVIAALEAALD